MAAGRLSRRWPTRRLGLVVTGVTGFALLQSLHSFYPQSAVVHVLCSSLLPPTQLAVVMSVSWMLLATRWQQMAVFFRLLGFYALFAFVVHRILLQTIHIGLHALQVGDARCQYLLLGASTMLLTFCLCWWRQYHAASLRPSTPPGWTDHITPPSDGLVGLPAGDERRWRHTPRAHTRPPWPANAPVVFQGR